MGTDREERLTIVRHNSRWRTGHPDQIWGLGPRRIGEIEVALVFVGLTRDHGGPLSDNR
ncbi:hypothetical protein [Streptosporangium sp. NPDC002607]